MLIVVRVLSDLAGAFVVGGTMLAAFLLPTLDGAGSATQRVLGPAAYRLLRLTGLVALGWAVAAAALAVLTAADLIGRPVSQLPARVVLSFVQEVSQGRALTLQVVLALAVALTGRLALTRTGAGWAAVAALVGVVTPAFTGHAASAGNHQLATSSLVVHVLAASVWAGGLAALLLVRPRSLLTTIAPAFSRLALVAFAAVAVSGIANAAIRLGGWGVLVTSTYGLLVVAKAVALVAAGVIGALHRRWSLRRLAAGARAAFLQLAAAEVGLLAITFGLAATLSRTVTPAPTLAFDPVVELTGFAEPPPLTASRLFTQALPDLLILSVVAALAGLYLAGVRRMRHAGHPWPWARTASWLGGLAVLVFCTCLGLARYAYVLFSVHMAQHMVLTMIVPGLLVVGAPITLALRTLGPSARQWLLTLLHSRYLRVVGHPIVALAIYVVGLYALYFSSALPTLMRSHLGHLFMIVHFVLSGYLLTWVLIGTDPGRRRWAPPLLMLVLFIAMVFHAFFGVAMMMTQGIIGESWYAAVHPAWASSLQSDQTVGAGIAWAFGEAPAAAMMIALVRQWIAADEREQRRVDRAAARAEADGTEDELARYNAYLRRINGLPPASPAAAEVAGTSADPAATKPA